MITAAHVSTMSAAMRAGLVKAMGAQPPLFRRAQPTAWPYLPLVFAALYAAQAFAAYRWTLSPYGLAVMWMGNSVLAAGLLLTPWRGAVFLAAAAFAIDLAGYVLMGGFSPGRAAFVAGLDLCEALTVALLVRRYGGAALDVTRVRRLGAVILKAFLPAALVFGALYTAIAVRFFGEDATWSMLIWSGGDFLSMLVAIPALLTVVRAARRPNLNSACLTSVGVGLALVAAMAAVFAIGETGIFLFLAPLLMLLAPFVTRAPIVACANVAVAFAASAFTMAGLGPIAAAEPDRLEARILILQLFLAAVALSSLVATALLSERARAQRLTRRSLQAARAARRAAVAAAQAKSRFLSVVSHEMRTPLNGVLGHAQVLRMRGGLDAAANDQIGEIEASGAALANIVEELIDFSALEYDSVTLAHEPFDLGLLVDCNMIVGRSLARGKPLVLTAEIKDGCRAGHMGDKRRLGQVLLHLLSNAIRFTPEGRIHVTAEVTPISPEFDMCRLSVSDTGIGVALDMRDAIFQPFGQADGSSTRRFGGLGLGLSISASLVRLMGGTIEVDSTPGLGSVFVVELALPRRTKGVGALRLASVR